MNAKKSFMIRRRLTPKYNTIQYKKEKQIKLALKTTVNVKLKDQQNKINTKTYLNPNKIFKKI